MSLPIIRQASEDDAPGIAQVHVTSWQTTYPGIFPTELLENLSVSERERQWRSWTRSGEGGIFVAEAEAKVVGFGACGQERSGETIYTGEVYALYLLGSYQGQGLGKALFTACQTELAAQNHQDILVWVATKNQSALHFYQAIGGQIYTERTVTLLGQSVAETALIWQAHK